MNEWVGVIPKDLATGALWPQIADLVQQAMKYGRGEYEIDDIRDAIAGDSMFAIGVVNQSARIEFVAVCSVWTMPRKKVLYVAYGAGLNARRAEAALLAAAKTLEVDWIETRCRESVARLYHQVGFDTAYRVCILEQ